ncbi:Monoacylglycerol lipase [Candidatus Thermoflexus japonica]|uniref:Monoacylglycerol lipase n=1 Tax=Candidatus Thermoflexus japonica TaxID=2035417 RepID=A0A2H5Y743_9CHLR|nr:Monoacylglycerol lipase [Candidatus Thermoflexus japonica]
MVMVRTLQIKDHGLPLHLTLYESSPQAPVAIFIHGMTAHAGFYSDMIPGANYLQALAGAGLNVVALDLQGHGRSGGARGRFTYAEAIRNIRRAVDFALETYHDRIGITGSSMGGILAFYAALEDPRIRAAVCHNVLDLRDIRPVLYLRRHFILVPLARATRPLQPILGELPIPVRAFLEPSHVFEKPENRHRWLRDPHCVWAYRLKAWVSVFLEPSDKPPVEAMTKPVRLLVGEHDRILPADMHRAFAARLRGRSDLIVVPGAGHMLPLEYLETTVPLVAEWFHEHLHA